MRRRQPLGDLGLGFEIVGLVAQVKAGVGRQLRPQRPRWPRAARRRCRALRRPGSHDQVVAWNTVVMPLAIACRSLSTSATSTGKSTPGRGIICRSNASPCISTMPGSTKRPPASMASDAARMPPHHGADFPTGDSQRGFGDLVAEQGPAAFDERCRHDAALRSRLLEKVAAAVAASYLSRNSSTASLRKSGSARRSVSWSQSHQRARPAGPRSLPETGAG